MTGHCRACHWWTAHDPPFDTGWGECRLISDETGSRLASAIGREPGEGYLMTRAEFGCVEFDPISSPAAWVGEGAPP